METICKELERKVNNGECIIKRKEGKSSIWKLFGIICNVDGSVIKNYVICTVCKHVYPYESHKTGTTNLLKHKCNVQKTSIISFFKQNVENSVAATPEMKNILIEKCVSFVVKDIRPFEIVNGEGIKDFAKCLINIGAKYGQVNIDQLLPHPVTISRKTKLIADKLRDELKVELELIFDKIGGAITTDMWTDDYRKISYLGITAHYIKNFKLYDRVLCTTKFESDLPKTGENIKKLIIQLLREFNVFDHIQNVVFVTDRGPNMIAALKSMRRLNCTAHVINTVLEHTMRFQNMEESMKEVLENTISAVRALVTFFKRSGLQSRLEITLKGDCETRWNSKLAMLTSITMQWDEIVKILNERNEIHRLNDVNKNILETLIQFLESFKKTTEQLEGSTYPTLYLVIVHYKRLLNHLSTIETNSELLTQLKINAKIVLQSTLKIDIIHKLAVFLHPKLKSLNIFHDLFNDCDKDIVHAEIRKLLCTMQQKSSKKHNDTNQKNPCDQIPKKMRKIDLSDFEDSENESDQDELNQYLSIKVSKSDEFDLLEWWKQQSSSLPTLTKIAEFVHSVPATSAPAERDFSQANLVLQSHRTNLSPNTVDDILFLHSNMDKH